MVKVRVVGGGEERALQVTSTSYSPLSALGLVGVGLRSAPPAGDSGASVPAGAGVSPPRLVVRRLGPAERRVPPDLGGSAPPGGGASGVGS